MRPLALASVAAAQCSRMPHDTHTCPCEWHRCMPQGRKKTLAERTTFAFITRHRYLYLGMHVLILLDVSYPSRCTDSHAC